MLRRGNQNGTGTLTVKPQDDYRVSSVSGTVVAVQESRFQLALDNGARRLFVLAHDAAVEPEQLISLQREQVRVTVTHRQGDGLIADEAHAITRA
jgi:hypothetical protein